MELYAIRYVLSVAEYENFSLAAQACYVGQSALSQQVAKLEAELGVALFIRNSRGAKLTEAGKVFVHRAREILQRVDALQAEMEAFSGLRKGSLNLGIITSLQCIDFGRMLSAFCNTYPNISVNIIQSGTHQLISHLLEGNLDIAFMNLPITRLPLQLAFEKLGEDRFSLAVSQTHRLAERDCVSLYELKDESFIFHQTGQVASELCLQACRKAGFDPHIVCRSGNPTTGLYMVQGGSAIAFFPTEEFQDRSIDGIKELKIKESIIKEVGICWRRENISPVIDAIVQFAKHWVDREY